MSKVIPLYPDRPKGVFMADRHYRLYQICIQPRLPLKHVGKCLLLTLYGEDLADPIEIPISIETARELQLALQSAINQLGGGL